MSAEIEFPQLYLVTPPEIELMGFPELLAQVLDTYDTACLRLTLSTSDEDRIMRAADACREVAHARDVPIVISEHALLVERLGLDGVHLGDGARRVRATRDDLGGDAIVGSYCAASRHDGMTAGEVGADYVSFGPAGATALGDGSRAEPELFSWWSQMIEVPIVAEGALDEDTIRALTPVTDFFAIGEEIWRSDDPVATLGRLLSAMRG
ncbi:thiamine phosphate synthase [Aliiroseovarius marinus]|uniref:thiamine phosphate synthase n=1 Tax=Aliiroseovarius marinus TaxID=2500159 RepID=UPI003D7EAB63